MASSAWLSCSSGTARALGMDWRQPDDVVEHLPDVDVAADVHGVGAVDVLGALVREVREPAADVELAGRGVAALSLDRLLAALLEAGRGDGVGAVLARRASQLRRRLSKELLELREHVGPDLVGVAVVLDEGVVVGDDQAALEVDALARALAADGRRSSPAAGSRSDRPRSPWKGPSGWRRSSPGPLGRGIDGRCRARRS